MEFGLWYWKWFCSGELVRIYLVSSGIFKKIDLGPMCLLMVFRFRCGAACHARTRALWEMFLEIHSAVYSLWFFLILLRDTAVDTCTYRACVPWSLCWRVYYYNTRSEHSKGGVALKLVKGIFLVPFYNNNIGLDCFFFTNGRIFIVFQACLSPEKIPICSRSVDFLFHTIGWFLVFTRFCFESP